MRLSPASHCEPHLLSLKLFPPPARAWLTRVCVCACLHVGGVCSVCACVGLGPLSPWFSPAQAALGCGTTSRVGSLPAWVRWSWSAALNSSESSIRTKVSFPLGLP